MRILLASALKGVLWVRVAEWPFDIETCLRCNAALTGGNGSDSERSAVVQIPRSSAEPVVPGSATCAVHSKSTLTVERQLPVALRTVAGRQIPTRYAHEFCSCLRLLEAVVLRRKRNVFHCFDIGLNRPANACFAIHKVANESRLFARKDSEHVMHDQDLT